LHNMAETLHNRRTPATGTSALVEGAVFQEHDPYIQPSQTGAATTRGVVRSGPKREGHAARAARLKSTDIQKANQVFARKLSDMKREPPSQFHAPNGYKSLRGARPQGKQRSAAMPGREISKPQVEWPAPPDESRLINREMEQREIQQENRRLASKLEDRYKVRNDSFVTANKLGKGIDMREKWEGRTDIYRGAAGRGNGSTRMRGSGRREAATARHASAGGSGVPKTLGVAQCSGCGKKGYFGAGGKKLQPCEHCGSVWYCSDTCAKVDWPHHKQMCKYKSNGEKHGSWMSAPAPEDCWVTNAAMAKGRKLLAEKTKRYPDGDATRRIQHEMQRVALADAEKQAVRRDVERRAYFGMDGPRPCSLPDS